MIYERDVPSSSSWAIHVVMQIHLIGHANANHGRGEKISFEDPRMCKTFSLFDHPITLFYRNIVVFRKYHLHSRHQPTAVEAESVKFGHVTMQKKIGMYEWTVKTLMMHQDAPLVEQGRKGMEVV